MSPPGAPRSFGKAGAKSRSADAALSYLLVRLTFKCRAGPFPAAPHSPSTRLSGSAWRPQGAHETTPAQLKIAFAHAVPLHYNPTLAELQIALGSVEERGRPGPMSIFGTSVQRFVTENVRICTSAIRAPRPPLKVVHLTDVHVRDFTQQHVLLAEAVSAFKPDLILLTGDSFDGHPDHAPALARLMRSLRCEGGIYACRGNWEMTYPWRDRELQEMFSEWKATLLINQWVVVERPAGTIKICALDDITAGWPDIEAALGPQEDQVDFSVMLSHAPLAAKLLPPDAKVDLVLSGHTHGGQIRIPLLWQLAIRTHARGHGGFTSGLYEVDGRQLYVNRGFGAVGFLPFRFRCPAEVAFLTLSPVQ